MIIPIGHESDKVRRLPWISFFLMASCIFIFILTSVEISRTSKELKSTAKELLNYYLQHPYLKLDPEIKKMLFGEEQNADVDKILGAYRRKESGKIHLFQEEEQEKLDRLSQKLRNTITDSPYRKYGYIPAQKSLIGLVTYMFIHGGLLHLLGNLLLLYLTGPFIEDVWGRPIYAGFYIMAGIFSGFMFSLYYPHFTGPLIGASGAIAGLMGAFLIRYWKTKIKFFYIVFLFVRGTFKAPAWLMLPVWLALEIFNANAIGSVNADGGGVAHWAHVWGFLFGVVVAFGMKYFKIEEKYIHPKIEAQVHFVDEAYKASEEATQKINEGKPQEAYALLLGAARKNPTNRDLVESLWNQGKELGKEKEAAEFYTRMIEGEIRRNLLDVALVHYMDLKEKVPQVSLNITCKFMLMKYLTERQDYKEAKKLANELIEEVDLNTSPGLLHNFATVASEHSPEIAKKVIELCLEHPEIGEELKEELKAKLKKLQSRLTETPAVSDVGEAHEVVGNAEQITAELESRLGLSPEAQPGVEDEGQFGEERAGRPAFEEESRPPGIQPLADTISRPAVRSESQPTIRSEGQPEEEPAVKKGIEISHQTESEPQIQPLADTISRPAVRREGQPEEEPAVDQEIETDNKTESEPQIQPLADTISQPAIRREDQPAAVPVSQPGIKPEIPLEPESGNLSRVEPEGQSILGPDKPERSTAPNQSIMAIKATPLSVKDGKIELDMDQIGQQLLPLDKIQSIAIAEIASDQEPPFLLIDLFLDDPKKNNHNVRAIRLLSTNFDPTKFSPGVQDHQDALKVFVSVLLKLSGATAYPDEESILLEAPQSFFTIEDYEKSILA